MRIMQDVRFALRTFGQNPGFTAVVFITLAVTIGVNAAVFAIVNAIIFKGLPFENGDRVMYLSLRTPQRGSEVMVVSHPDFRHWQTHTKSFEGLAAFAPGQLNLGGDDNFAEVYPVSLQTANTFALVGERPVIGRDFTAADDARGAPDVVILSYGLWERRYGRDQSVVGKTVRLNGVPATIIGVMPQGFAFPMNVDLWTPLPDAMTVEQREVRNLHVFGPLRPDVDLPAAQAEMTTIWKNLQRDYPDTNGQFTVVVETFHHAIIGDANGMFGSLLAAVAFVLLIASANVANLQLARAIRRAREISVRISLGATPRRVIQQLLTESVILAGIAGLVGLALGYWGARTFDLMVTPLGKPRWMTASIDGRVLAYVATISLGTAIVFGLAPALRLLKLDVQDALKDGNRTGGISVRGRRLAAALVIGEVALAMVLLAGAGVMIRSFLNVYAAPIGVESANVLTMRLALPPARYAGPDPQIAFHDRLKTRLEAVPGVSAVALTTHLPTRGSMSLPYELQGGPAETPLERPVISTVVVGPDYFEVWNVRLSRGRAFTDFDTATSVPVAIVSEAFAARSWGREDPTTKSFRIFDGSKPGPWLTVVGVVPNIVQNDVSGRKIDPVIYLPFRQKPSAGATVIARTTVPPDTLATAFRREVQVLDADLPIFNLWPMEERLRQNYSFIAIITSLFALFAIVALLLASTGLYAVIAYSVDQRTQEIGIRLALGAPAPHVLARVFMNGMAQVALGLALGLAGAFGLTRVLNSVVIGVSSTDPTSFVVAAAVLAGAAAVGSLVPALRAMRLDPVVALRSE